MINKYYKDTDNFNKARIGTPVLEACRACGIQTGNIIIKMKEFSGLEYTGPRLLRNPEARCEFCTFLSMWIAQEGHDLQKDGKVGAAKIIERLENGTERLVAFLPFIEKDERNNQLFDGTPFEFKHGMVIRAEAEKESTRMKLVEILKEGV